MNVLPGPCDTLVLPDECFDQAYQIADCLVDAAAAAVAPFLPTEPVGCTPIRSFVSFSSTTQPDDCCNQISVILESITPQGRAKCWTHWHLVYRIEAVFLCFPHLEEDVNSEVYLPSAAEQELASRWLYAIGFALAGGIWGTLNDPGACTAFTGADNVAMSGLMPSGPRGACAGWNLKVTIDHRGMAATPVPPGP